MTIGEGANRSRIELVHPVGAQRPQVVTGATTLERCNDAAVPKVECQLYIAGRGSRDTTKLGRMQNNGGAVRGSACLGQNPFAFESRQGPFLRISGNMTKLECHA